MTAKSVSITVTGPSLRGLNLQQEGSLMSWEWASVATNCIFDDSGRLGVRNGWTALNSTPPSGSPDFKRVHEFIKDDGTSLFVSSTATKLFEGTGTLTEITGTAISAPTAGEWKFVNLNGDVIGAQDSHQPIFWAGVPATNVDKLYNQIPSRANTTAYSVGDVVRISTADGTVYWHCTTGGTSAGAEPAMSTTVGATTTDGTVTWTTRTFPVNGNSALAAFGRLWITDDNETTIYYSDLLQPWKFSGGSSGTISMVSVWTHGMDTISALAEYNGRLVIFGKNSITLYTGAGDPSTMSKEEQITNTGCVARDSVQHVGPWLFFLSNSGIKSLDRAIQAGSLPLIDLSKNVRDDLVAKLSLETAPINSITSVYHEAKGFYLVNFPTTGNTYCFDVKYPMEDGTLKCTKWASFNPAGMISTRDRKLYVAFRGGYLGQYGGYIDRTSMYDISYYTAWSDLSQHASDGQTSSLLRERIKIPKRIGLTTQVANSMFVTLKLQYDYTGSIITGDSVYSTLGTNAEFNIAEFNIGEFSGGGGTVSLPFSGAGSGKTVRFGFSATVSGVLSFQQLNLLVKIGRQSL